MNKQRYYWISVSLLAINLLFANKLYPLPVKGNAEYDTKSVAGINNKEKPVRPIYISPLPGSKYIKPQTNIIIRSKSLIDAADIHNSSILQAKGSVSGLHKGKINLSDDGRTIVFLPYTPFTPGEKVSIRINKGIRTVNGNYLQDTTFNFSISGFTVSREYARQTMLSEISKEFPQPVPYTKPAGTKNNSFNKVAGVKELPNDFPVLKVTQSNNPSPGYIFLSNFTIQQNSPYGNYLMIVDNAGNPVFYRKMPDNCFDFKMQPDGLITYFDSNTMKFYAMNTSFAVVDSFTCGNGYVNDVHELIVLPDGHFFLLCDDYETIDMSQIVPGGNPNATVMGIVIQELDKNRNVVFQWRSFDHINITDATEEDLTAANIDYIHSNSIDIEPDGNLLLSSRHTDEVTKININTGDIIWRLGGKNNQFNFINDPVGFSHQHAARYLPGGDITIFDDGNFHSPPFSRGVEYKLDEQNMTADLVWQYRNNPDIYAFAMGYVQRLKNGNSLIGWGTANPSVTEVMPDGAVALEMSLPENEWSYRAFKFPLIILNSPNGGEKFAGNSSQEILWTASGVDSVNIDYSSDNGADWNRIITAFPADSEKYLWTVPNLISANCKLRVYDAGITAIPDTAVSDSSFSIQSTVSVKLDSLTLDVQNSVIQINWVTESEKNNYGFIIQRKFTAQDWQDLGFVKSAGNSSRQNDYTFVDNLDTTTFQGEIFYRLGQIDLNGNTHYLKEISTNVNLFPQNYTLFYNYPNPFNPSTIIKYELPADSRVTLKIYNITGQLIKVLVNYIQTAGAHKIVFNGAGLPSGIYFDEIIAASLDGKQNFSAVKKMILLK